MTRSRIDTDQSGFTLVEMMIATMVFSVVLLLCAIGVVQVGRQFYKGVTINRVQNTARLVADDVSQAIQFGPGKSDGTYYSSGGVVGGIQSVCLGTVRYTYTLNQSLGTTAGQSRHVLWKDRLATVGSACTPASLNTALTGGQELLGEDMRLPRFTVTPPVPPSTSWTINIAVAYGKDDDLFEPQGLGRDYTRCVGTKLGGQFCATSIINTKAVKRLQ